MRCFVFAANGIAWSIWWWVVGCVSVLPVLSFYIKWNLQTRVIISIWQMYHQCWHSKLAGGDACVVKNDVCNIRQMHLFFHLLCSLWNMWWCFWPYLWWQKCCIGLLSCLSLIWPGASWRGGCCSRFNIVWCESAHGAQIESALWCLRSCRAHIVVANCFVDLWFSMRLGAKGNDANVVFFCFSKHSAPTAAAELMHEASLALTWHIASMFVALVKKYPCTSIGHWRHSATSSAACTRPVLLQPYARRRQITLRFWQFSMMMGQAISTTQEQNKTRHVLASFNCCT